MKRYQWKQSRAARFGPFRDWTCYGQNTIGRAFTGCECPKCERERALATRLLRHCKKNRSKCWRIEG